ncbi:DUF1641 domain-containing protein [Brevibacillus dissolubilis]|uniref:DUF1641 domain-containing protein n=1 Tax=Brevibacillus dissolubilis TaxID=1844116 RepID=UPI001116F4B6|nr:DUF1641 domain-containing protein [Brevibacillus dissolubilis]
MAKAIRHIEKATPNPVQEQAASINDLLVSLADSRDALVRFLDILREAEKAGLLDILYGVLKARHEIGYQAINQLNQPSMHHTIKNAMGIVSFLGQVDPNQLQIMLGGISHGLKRASEPPEDGRAPGLWGLAKDLRDPGVSSTLHTAMEFMKGMGEHLRNESHPSPH